MRYTGFVQKTYITKYYQFLRNLVSSLLIFNCLLRLNIFIYVKKKLSYGLFLKKHVRIFVKGFFECIIRKRMYQNGNALHAICI